METKFLTPEEIQLRPWVAVISKTCQNYTKNPVKNATRKCSGCLTAINGCEELIEVEEKETKINRSIKVTLYEWPTSQLCEDCEHGEHATVVRGPSFLCFANCEENDGESCPARRLRELPDEMIKH